MLSFKNQQPYKAIPPTHFILKCKVLYSPLSYVPFTFHNLKWYYGIGRATLGATHHALDPPELGQVQFEIYLRLQRFPAGILQLEISRGHTYYFIKSPTWH
jgi:hypothetical protein